MTGLACLTYSSKMVQLQEITDAIETNLKISETTPPPTSTPASQPLPAPPPPSQNALPAGPAPPPTAPGAALPPQLALTANKTVDEILADLNKSPLFMTELDDANNPHLEALNALAYEGTPLENATDFKSSGNDAFRERRWADAREFYGRGITLMRDEEKQRRANAELPTGHASRTDDVPDDDTEVAAQRSVLEALLVNRAACQLELGNQRQCWLDSAATLALNPRNVKAWYRSARALLAVGRTAEAGEACAGGLAADPANKPLQGLRREVEARAALEARKVAEEEARKGEAARTAWGLRMALEARGVRVRKSERPPDMGDARLELVEGGEGGEGTLNFPAVLLYPAHYESDFIKAFSEKESLMQHFGYVFPLPWDKAGEYSANGVECFMETVTGGLVKVGKKVTLLKVVTLDNVEVVDGVVRIFVIPKNKAEAWVAEFKAAKAKEKAKEGK